MDRFGSCGNRFDRGTEKRMAEEIRVAEPGLRLDRFLALRFPDYARAHFQDLIARGRVKVEGINRPADYHLQTGQVVAVEWPGYEWGDIRFENWVIHEDRDILVLNKPTGLLMHPIGESWLKTPQAALSESQPNLAGLLLRFRPKIAEAGVARCGLVHRLDRETSGVLAVAKTQQAQEALVAAFAERRTQKVYRAIVLGEMDPFIEVEAPLGRKTGGRRIAVNPYGKSAVTAFKLVKKAKGTSLVEARPLTGRTHQIRAHFSHIRHPVLGDPEWAVLWEPALKERGLPLPPRLMLHAYRLTVPHPRTGKPARFSAPLPKDFKEYWNLMAGPR
jgi:23S rRNA pseudouridine1911/1915/1917 synthase